MAKQQDCLPPVTIGGITITPELLQLLFIVKTLRPDCASYFAEQCLILSTLDFEDIGLDRSVYYLLLDFYRILKELNKDQEGPVK